MTRYLWIAAVSLGLATGCTPKDEPASGGGAPAPAAGSEAKAGAMPAAAELETIAAAGPVEIGCARCVFEKMDVDGCPPAVKLGETVLLLKGYEPESEHALCSGATKAKVEGKVEGGTFVATKVELIAEGE